MEFLIHIKQTRKTGIGLAAMVVGRTNLQEPDYILTKQVVFARGICFVRLTESETWTLILQRSSMRLRK